MLYRDRETGWFYILNESDNYGYDCYSYDMKGHEEDGFIPFCADMSCCQTKEDIEKEENLIGEWNEVMTEEQRIDYCLKGLETSLERCDLISEEDVSSDELFDYIPDVIKWGMYCDYLKDWVDEHRGSDFLGMSPVCYDEWCDNRG